CIEELACTAVHFICAPCGCEAIVSTARSTPASERQPKALELVLVDPSPQARADFTRSTPDYEARRGPRRCSSISKVLELSAFSISWLSVLTLNYRILRHPLDPASGGRSHSSCRYWSRRNCNILL